MSTILVVEDNDDVREEIVAILQLEGHEVLEADNGRVALNRLQTAAPDLILCDLMMPELDGYATLQRIRADRRWTMLPVIFLTARAEQVDVQQAMALGADQYVVKPFTSDELLAAIGATLTKRATVTARDGR